MEENALADLESINSEDVDIYQDLCDFDLGDEIEKVKTENKKLERQIKHLHGDIANLKSTVAELEGTRNNLERNISTLFKTAKAEIERKNRIIEELRSEGESNQPNKCDSTSAKRKDRECSPLETSKTKRCKLDNQEENCVSDTEAKSGDKQESASQQSNDRHQHPKDNNKHRNRSPYPSDRYNTEKHEVRFKYSDERYKEDDRHALRNKYGDKYNSYEDDGYSSRSRYSYDRYPDVLDRCDPRIRYYNDRYYTQSRSNEFFNDDRYSAYERENYDYMQNSRNDVRDRLAYDRENCASEIEGQSTYLDFESVNCIVSNYFGNEERRLSDRAQHGQYSSDLKDYASWRKHRESLIETAKNTATLEEGNFEERRSITPEASWIEHDEIPIETKNIEMEEERGAKSDRSKVKPAKKRLKMLDDMEKKMKLNRLSQAGNVTDPRVHTPTGAGKSKSTLARSTNDDDRHFLASSRFSKSDKSYRESELVTEKVSNKTAVKLHMKMDERTNKKISRTSPILSEFFKKFRQTKKNAQSHIEDIHPGTIENTSAEKIEDVSFTKKNTKNLTDKLEMDDFQITKKSSSKPKPEKSFLKNEEGKSKHNENDKGVSSDAEKKEQLSKKHLKIHKAGKSATDLKSNSKSEGKSEERESKRGNEKGTVGENECKNDAKQGGDDENMVKIIEKNLSVCENVEVGRKVEKNKERPSKSTKTIEDKPKDNKNINDTKKCKKEENILEILANDRKDVPHQKSDSEQSWRASKQNMKQPRQDLTRQEVRKESVNNGNKTNATYGIEKDSEINHSEKQRDQLLQKAKPVVNDIVENTNKTKRDEVTTDIKQQSENNTGELKRKRRQSTYLDQDDRSFPSEHISKSSGIELKQSTHEERYDSHALTEDQSENFDKFCGMVSKPKKKQSTNVEQYDDMTHRNPQSQNNDKSSNFGLKLKRIQSTLKEQDSSHTCSENQLGESRDTIKSSGTEFKAKQKQSTDVDQDDNTTHCDHQSEYINKSSGLVLKPKQKPSMDVEQDDITIHHDHQSANCGKSSSFELKQSTFEAQNDSGVHTENQSEDIDEYSSMESKSIQKQSTDVEQNAKTTHCDHHSENDDKSSNSGLKLKRRQSPFEERDDSHVRNENQSGNIDKSSGMESKPKQKQFMDVEQDNITTYCDHQSENDNQSLNVGLKLKRRQSSYEERADSHAHTKSQSEDIDKASGIKSKPKQTQSTDTVQDDKRTDCERQSKNNDAPSSFELKQKRIQSTFEERDTSVTQAESYSEEIEQKQRQSINVYPNESTIFPKHQTENSDKSTYIELKRKRRRSLFVEQNNSSTRSEHQSKEIGESSSIIFKRKRRQSTHIEQDVSMSENNSGNSNYVGEHKELEKPTDKKKRLVSTATNQNFSPKHSPEKTTQIITRSKLKLLEEESKINEKYQNDHLKESKEMVPLVKEPALNPTIDEHKFGVNEIRRIKFPSNENINQQTVKKSENVQGHTTAKNKPTSPKKNSKYSNLTLPDNENLSGTSCDSQKDSGKLSDSTEKNKRRPCKSNTKSSSSESSSTSSSSDDDDDDRVGKSKNISTSSNSSESEIKYNSSEDLLNTVTATRKLIEIKNVKKEKLVPIKSVGSSDSSVSDDGPVISSKRMLTEKRIDNLIKSCMKKFINETKSCDSQKCTTSTVTEIKEKQEDNSTNENVTSKSTDSKIKTEGATVTTAAYKAATKCVTNSEKATSSSSVSNNTRSFTRRRITPIPVKDSEPHCSFQNVVAKPRRHETLPTATPVDISPLHLTQDGEIPVLHLEDNHINNMPTEVNINDKNIITLLESMNISNIHCDIPKFRSVSGENTVNSVLSASGANDCGLTFENIMQKVAPSPAKAQSVEKTVKGVSGRTNSNRNSASAPKNTTNDSVVDSTPTLVRRGRRRCRLVIIDRSVCT